MWRYVTHVVHKIPFSIGKTSRLKRHLHFQNTTVPRIRRDGEALSAKKSGSFSSPCAHKGPGRRCARPQALPAPPSPSTPTPGRVTLPPSGSFPACQGGA